MSGLFLLLLQRAEDSAHADRAWSWLQTQPVPARPSELLEQVQAALAATQSG